MPTKFCIVSVMYCKRVDFVYMIQNHMYIKYIFIQKYTYVLIRNRYVKLFYHFNYSIAFDVSLYFVRSRNVCVYYDEASRTAASPTSLAVRLTTKRPRVNNSACLRRRILHRADYEERGRERESLTKYLTQKINIHRIFSLFSLYR